MDPFLTEEHKIFREEVRKFAQREIEPLVEDAEREQKFPKELIARAREAGLLGLSIPEKYGGVGADMLMVSIVSEELVRMCAGIGVGLFSVILGPGAIAATGTEEQKQKYLPSAVSGKKVFCLAITEPDAGSDVSAIRTTAKEDGDHFILNGAKTWISNAHVADVALVYAKTEPALKHKGMTKHLLWEEYTQAYPNRSYSYPQYCFLYQEWASKQKRSMRQVHKAGD